MSEYCAGCSTRTTGMTSGLCRECLTDLADAPTLRARLAEVERRLNEAELQAKYWEEQYDNMRARVVEWRTEANAARAEERKVEAVFTKLVEEIHALPVPRILLAPPEAAQAWHDGFKSAKEFFVDTLARAVCAMFPTPEPPHA